MRTRLRLIIMTILSCSAVALLVNRVFRVPLRSQPGSSSRLVHGAVAAPAAPGSVSSQVMAMALAEAARAEKRAASPGSKDEQQMLMDAFKRCDSDGSQWLSLEEAVACISHQVSLHLTQAIRENFFIFTAVDRAPSDGHVTWSEHLTYYLRKRGYDQAFIDQHLTTMKGLGREEKESIMRDKAAWSEAARDDPDSLSLDEFLAFRHPESSHATILTRVEELLARMDGDGDGALSRAEYQAGSPGSQELLLEHSAREFEEIDSNSDGKLDRKELLLYRDPRHPHHPRLEAQRLFSAADTDSDGRLSLRELLLQPRLFADSKMVDAATSFHNEF